MSTITRFEDIRAWQTAREITRAVYALSSKGAFAQDFALRDQMRRAAVSIMSNIAEGFESHTQALFINYLGRAKASCAEVRAQAYVALDASYIDQDHFDGLYRTTDKCSRQLRRFMDYLESVPNSRRIRETGVEYHVEDSEI